MLVTDLHLICLWCLECYHNLKSCCDRHASKGFEGAVSKADGSQACDSMQVYGKVLVAEAKGGSIPLRLLDDRADGTREHQNSRPRSLESAPGPALCLPDFPGAAATPTQQMKFYEAMRIIFVQSDYVGSPPGPSKLERAHLVPR
ncbi:hypothetical protein NDU88_006389 [Pleurodeles waltl]|uniref:Uncharacterized protein n=1 Tax=Pleurodeles waltl TaxID=8319 RepID=A0AAV7TDR6_PLEWA|nr:hypothetical protein NDU88_006389 [Pleurodeles waltl]